MTKEELEKEAEEYLHKDGTEAEKLVKDIGILCLTKKQLNGFFAIFKQIYIESAEPREKRIAELENKLTEKVTLESLDIVSARIKELEKENAELKERIKTLEQIKREHTDYTIKVEEERTFVKDQLTNAKEIISEYINILKGDTKNWKKTQEKAEQFLKDCEVEK